MLGEFPLVMAFLLFAGDLESSLVDCYFLIYVRPTNLKKKVSYLTVDGQLRALASTRTYSNSKKSQEQAVLASALSPSA